MNRKTYNVAFFGTPDFAVPMLEALFSMPEINVYTVVTQPDRPVGKKQVISPPPIKTLAEKNNVTVLQPQSIKTKEFEQELKELKLDAVIIVAYGKIIPENLLDIPTHGWLNVHASLLPNYRGASPIQAAILAGEDTTGVTLMKIDKGLDTGPTIVKKQCSIKPDDNFEILHDSLSKLGAKLIKESLIPYLNGELQPEIQDESPTSVTKKVSRKDGQVDWTEPAEQIERQIRAYTPWPGAYCFCEGKRLKILETVVIQLPSQLPPGTVLQRGNSIIVGTKKNGLQLKTIQLEGKKKQPIESFIKGYPEFVKAVLE